MATLSELHTIYTDALADPPSPLWGKVMAAGAVVALEIQNEPPSTPEHDTRVIWSRPALDNPEGFTKRALWFLLGANASFTPAQITGASDEAILQAVRDMVASLV